MKSNPSGTASNKEMSYKARKRETQRLISQLKILTPNARERWAILTTMLETTINKIKSGKEKPILLRPKEMDDWHKVGSIRNAIDLLAKNSPPVVSAHEIEVDPYMVRITREGVNYLLRELDLWKELEKIASVDTLTKGSLEIICKILDELYVLFNRFPEKKP